MNLLGETKDEWFIVCFINWYYARENIIFSYPVNKHLVFD